MPMLGGGIANLFGTVFAALYLDGTLHAGLTEPVYDGQGNITGYAGSGDTPIKYQHDAATWAMRRDEGFVEGDAQIIVLARAGGRSVTITTDHEISEANGKQWKVMTAELDAASSHWICRGRSA